MSSQIGATLKWIAILLLLIFAALILPNPIAGQDEVESPNETSELAMGNDMLFSAGEEVVVSQATTDDIFAAGSKVDVKGARADHLFLTGGDLTVSQAEVSDIIAAGGEIRLNAANVADDIVIAGGDIIANEGFEVGGTAVIAGGRVRFEAPVGQDLRIGASEIFINSTIGGTARLSGDTIELGPKARIQGDLRHRGENLIIDPAAIVEGTREQLPTSESYTAEDFSKGVGQFFLFFSLSIIVSYFAIVALLVLAVPHLMRSTSQMLQSKPWQALGIGVIYALVVPVLGIILLWTVLGIPLAVLLFVASLALTPIAVAVTAHFIGMAARSLVTKKTGPTERTAERILWPLSGVVILFALAMIPLVGLVVLLLAMLFGLGAFIKQAAGALTAPASEAATA